MIVLSTSKKAAVEGSAGMVRAASTSGTAHPAGAAGDDVRQRLVVVTAGAHGRHPSRPAGG